MNESSPTAANPNAASPIATPPPPRPARRRQTAAAAGAVLLAVVALSFGLGHRSGPASLRSSASKPDRNGGSAVSVGAAPTTFAPADGDKSAIDQRSASATPGTVESPPKVGGAPATPVAVSAAKIVKTASLDLEVRKGAASSTFTRLTTLAAGSGGFVAQQQTSESGGSPSGTITIRVPSASFEQTLAEARKLGSVQSATTGGQDVTNEYTDIDGRLKSLTDEREQLQIVLSAAGNVPDILSVRDRLTAVQTEIEQLQGRKNVLDDQISLATLAVSVHEKGDTSTPIPSPGATGFAKAWHDAAHGFNSSIQAIIAGSGRTAVVLLVGLVLFVIGRFALRAGRRHYETPSPTA